jgi:DNA-binding cell septation regulator SpoVG
MEIQNYKEIKKGFVKARFDITVPQWQLTIKDCTLFEKEQKQWISFPSRQYEAADGSKKYFELVSFPKEVKERFQTKCLEKLKQLESVMKTNTSEAEENIPF